MHFCSFRVIFGYYCAGRLVVCIRDIENDVSHVTVRSAARQYRHDRRLSVIDSFYCQEASVWNSLAIVTFVFHLQVMYGTLCVKSGS